MTYARATAPTGGLRLHLNENTAGCSPAVLEAGKRNVPGAPAPHPQRTAPTKHRKGPRAAMPQR